MCREKGKKLAAESRSVFNLNRRKGRKEKKGGGKKKKYLTRPSFLLLLLLLLLQIIDKSLRSEKRIHHIFWFPKEKMK